MMAVLHQYGHGHSHGNGHGQEHGGKADKKRKDSKNINVHAAFIHVVGDLIQSIGIVIAGYIIWFKVSFYTHVHNFSCCVLPRG